MHCTYVRKQGSNPTSFIKCIRFVFTVHIDRVPTFQISKIIERYFLNNQKERRYPHKTLGDFFNMSKDYYLIMVPEVEMRLIRNV